MESFVFVASTPPPLVKPPDGGTSKPHRSSFQYILTTVKEKEGLIEKRLMKVFLGSFSSSKGHDGWEAFPTTVQSLEEDASHQTHWKEYGLSFNEE